MNALNNDDLQLENMFAAHLDAMIARNEAAAALLAAQVPGEASDLLRLATQLHAALKPVEPSDEFVKRLRAEFVSESRMTLMLRWRTLPPRYQAAAKVGGATLTAGLTLLAVRRALNMLGTMRTRHRVSSDGALTLNTLS